MYLEVTIGKWKVVFDELSSYKFQVQCCEEKNIFNILLNYR